MLKEAVSQVKEALSGSHRDYTVGSLNRAIVLLSIPMILEMVMESLFGIVDVFFVSRLGATAVATVGYTESLLTIIFGVAIGLCMSTTAFVARRIGEKDSDGAVESAVQAIGLGVLVSVVFGVLGVMAGPKLLSAMGASAAVIANARYTQLMLGGSIFIFLLFLINAIFRGAGDAALAMRTLWLANAINIVLDPCLINGWGPFPRLGVFGASVATTTGRGIGVLFQLYQLSRSTNRIYIRPEQIRFRAGVMLRLLRVSITGILQFLIATASWLGLMRIVSTFGSAAVAGYTIAIRMLVFTILPAYGFSNAAATLGWTEPGSCQARTGRKRGIPNGVVQHAVHGNCLDRLLRLPVATYWTVHDRSGSSLNRRVVFGHFRGRLYELRVGHGADAGVQRRGRYDDANHRELHRVLAGPDSDGLLTCDSPLLRRAWGFLGRADRGLCTHRSFVLSIPAG